MEKERNLKFGGEMKIYRDIKHCCQKMHRSLDAGEVGIIYLDKYREYGINVFSTGYGTIQVIQYCPWCCNKFPVSLRDQWFKELEKMFGEDWEENQVPEEFKTSAWWKNRSL